MRRPRWSTACGGALTIVAAMVGVLLAATPASAHGPASTLVKVSVHAGAETGTAVVQLDAVVSLQELDSAYGTSLAVEARRTSTDSAVAAHRDRLVRVLSDRVRVADAASGQAWSTVVGSIRGGTDQGQPAVHAVLRATGPSADHRVELTWRVVTDVVASHHVYVGGVAADGTTTLVGVLTRSAPTVALTVEVPEAGPPRTLWGVGFDHFRGGADHLLFLSLVALGAARRRAQWATTARRLAGLTLAFTVGHSVSLALATLGWVSLPSRWVEVAIAVTILLAAMYAARPRLDFRAELAVTASFGLIHGFGFAGTLEDLDIHGRDLALPLVTFNLGLEAAQLAALALVVVPLLVIARSTMATRAVAGMVGVVAVSWILERALSVPNPLQPVLALVLGSPERFALFLLLGALVVLAVSRSHADPTNDRTREELAAPVR